MIDVYKLDAFTRQFQAGDKVNTPLGPGTVVYLRMKAPELREAGMYSVCLDSRKAESEQPPFPSYSGTTFPAEQVTEKE
jgi:hypothetical protein